MSFPVLYTGNDIVRVHASEQVNNICDAIPNDGNFINRNIRIYRETRWKELLAIKEILDEVQEYVLNVRIGATDFDIVRVHASEQVNNICDAIPNDGNFINRNIRAASQLFIGKLVGKNCWRLKKFWMRFRNMC
jgi:hypothetical protein